jgi:hypothetical protein
MKRRTITFALFGALSLGSALTLIVERVRAAGIPTSQALTYSGHLTKADGTKVNQMTSIALALFAQASGGDAICEAGGARVAVEDGDFQLPLPEACTAAVSANPDLWVDVVVEGVSVGRTKLGAVPYAIEADHAANAERAAYADIAGSATLSGIASAVATEALFTITDCTYGDGHTDCRCPENGAVLGGGACSSFDCVGETGVALSSAPADRRTWRIQCKNQAGAALECTDAYATCLRVE